jgi:hypothetical protein
VPDNPNEPNEPNEPNVFVSVKPGHTDGALLIGQADYHLSEKAKIEAGVWRYSTLMSAIA